MDLLGCDGNFPANGITCSDNTLFYAPLALGPGTPNTVYFGTDRLYRSANQGDEQHSGEPGSARDRSSRTSKVITAIGISSQDDNYRMVGTNDGHVWRTVTGSSTLVDVTGGWVAGTYVAAGRHRPEREEHRLRDARRLHGRHHRRPLARMEDDQPWKRHTHVGIQGQRPAGHSRERLRGRSQRRHPSLRRNGHRRLRLRRRRLDWTPFGTGLPVVAVFDMAVASPGTGSEVLRIATHGKGMWQVPISPTGSSFTLTVALAGSGSGTVTSVDTFIDCPGTCFHDYGSSTAVVLQQTPDAGSTFTSWTGCDSVVTGDCHIQVDAVQTVTATFHSDDSTPPTASMTLPVAPVNGSKAIGLAWSGDDGGGTGVKNFDIRVHKAKYTTSTFGSFTNPVALQATTGTSATFTGAPGFTVLLLGARDGQRQQRRRPTAATPASRCPSTTGA